MAAVEAIAAAVGSLANFGSSYINSAAQRYGLQKGMEAEGVSAARQKEMAGYQSGQTAQTLIIAMVVVLLLVLMLKNKRK